MCEANMFVFRVYNRSTANKDEIELFINYIYLHVVHTTKYFKGNGMTGMIGYILAASG